ncbi:hypothetical protein AX16_007103 [Volvariella volvacea WC 439]|nr:hypothetical protein AX16_007103 [Volvariella volvacea WC 439]
MLLAHLLPNALQLLLATLLSPEHQQTGVNPPGEGEITFELRHLYATTDSGRNVFSDIHSTSAVAAANSTYTIPTTLLTTSRQRPRDCHPDSAAISHHNLDPETAIEWDDHHVVGPRTDKRQTLLQLAKMTFNSFYDGPDGHQEWYELDPYWKKNHPFGWEPSSDGLRGQIFASPDNSTVVVAIKGTSAPWIVGGEDGPTKKKDKLNNNLLFSCCCGRVGPSWTPVCGCYADAVKGGAGARYRCDRECVERSLVDEESLFYPVGINLYNNISYMYPDANIWLTGHSLGGSLASLIGLTFGAPVVTFEAPGDRLAARRLHLPSPPSTQHIIQVYHTADPVPVGACTGIFSLCAIGGYAIESRCHLGQIIKYDTVGKKGWSVSIRNHPIQVMIDYVLSDDGTDWGLASEGGCVGRCEKREVPRPEVEKDCSVSGVNCGLLARSDEVFLD